MNRELKIFYGDQVVIFDNPLKVDMPILRPVRIPTIGLGWWKRAIAHFKARDWELYEDYILYIPWLDIHILVPKGFVFDGASIPSIFWTLLNPTGILLIGSLFHDFGYGNNYLLDNKLNKIYTDKGKVFFDELFRDINIFVNDAHIMINISWVVLRLFGGPAWRKCRKEDLKS